MFILSSVTGVPLGTVFRGVIPFVGVMAIGILILVFFPQIATWLPSLMT